MSDKVEFFLAGVSFTVVLRSAYHRALGWWVFRNIRKELACDKCKGRKTVDVLIRGTTSMETEKVTCPDCDGSGQKVLGI